MSNGGAMSNDDFTEPTFNNEQGKQVLDMQVDLLNDAEGLLPDLPRTPG